jgi:serine/threonine-protein kinase
MSHVYLGFDDIDELGPVAVKIAKDLKSSRWLSQEARVLGALKHPNIVRLLDQGSLPDGRTVNILEFVDGVSLKQVFQRGAWRLRDLLSWIEQLCDALGHAHAIGVVHGDLKPTNIHIRAADDSCCLCDFGLHAPESLRTVFPDEAMVLGSPRFIPPEHIRGEPLHQPADVYGLGVLVYRAITGAYPFQGHTKIETLAAHLFADFPPFSERAVKPVLAPELEPVLRCCLEKDPEARYPSTSTFYEAVAEALSTRL